MDRKEVFAMLSAAAPEAYRIAVAKGWWKDIDSPDKKAECTMLMVSELGEALDAHRKNRKFPISERAVGGSAWDREEIINVLNGNTTMTGTSYNNIFDMFCKGTIEEELADLIIRLLSYCGAYKIKLSDPDFRKESTKNFAHDLLKINNWILEAYHLEGDKMAWGNKDWNYVLKAIIVFCDWWNIDIITHVKWKLKYTELKTDTDGKSY